MVRYIDIKYISILYKRRKKIYKPLVVKWSSPLSINKINQKKQIFFFDFRPDNNWTVICDLCDAQSMSDFFFNGFRGVENEECKLIINESIN